MTSFDVIVIGAGHAGIEAAHACARNGLSTLVLCASLDSIGQMSCNPAIGGVAKGHVVREIDALGGLMAQAADATGIYFKMLNTSKGAAVRSPRAQADRARYREWMKKALEDTPHLTLRQEMAEAILSRGGQVAGVGVRTGQIYEARAVILTTGTFLRGVIHVGPAVFSGGRYGEPAAEHLSQSLCRLGLQLGRLKTGTPPRIHGKTVDWDRMDPQPPDEPPESFSFYRDVHLQNRVMCYLTRTNARTHQILADNRHRSPLFSGQITGVGPRYCPSIEDKVVRFPDRDSHQVLIEPEGILTEECYVNGLSTSTPPDVQEAMIGSIKGLEQARILRYGYAVEYDFCPPTQLHPWLETQVLKNLFLAGQINGTSGYEEAAAQGLVAGINAVRSLRKEPPFILGRHEAYIGVMVDDLVTKGAEEPYRLFTSLAEYRLLLRHDTADLRLMGHGRDMGLVDQDRWSRCQAKKKILQEQKKRMEAIRVPADRCIELLQKAGESLKGVPLTLAELLRRPRIDISDLATVDEELRSLDKILLSTLEAEVKYEGYIRMEMAKVTRFEKFEGLMIPEDFDYHALQGLRTEARVKLSKERPHSIGQASRMPGITPSDVWVIITSLKKKS